MRKQHEIIGIAGGLGPFAHIDFERKLLEAAQSLLGASGDQDYPEWVLSSMPQTPDRTLALQGGAEDPVPYLVRSIQRLTGADFACVPCNTAHKFLAEVSKQTAIPILDMIAETVREVQRHESAGRIGILATTGTLRSRLYHDALAKAGFEGVSPLDCRDGEALQLGSVMEPIYGPFLNGKHTGGGIKGLGPRPEFNAALEHAAQRLAAELGVRAIIAGCTEIPLALTANTVAGLPLIDPTRALAEAAIRRAYRIA